MRNFACWGVLALYASCFGSDFISRDEYQLSLYQNPRGIGCHKCHGLDGEQSLFATYKIKDTTHQVIIPSIKNISHEALAKRLNQKSQAKSIMPTYHLTPKEIKHLFLYLNKENQNDKQPNDK